MLHGSAKGIDVARVSYSTMTVRKQLDELVDFCFIELPRIIRKQALPLEAKYPHGEDSDMVAELEVLANPSSSKDNSGGEACSPGGPEMRRSMKRAFSPGKETFPGGANQQCPLEAQVEHFSRQSVAYVARKSVASRKSGSMSPVSLTS